jgi:ethanolamine ammonia-lyase small subunit
MEDRLLALHDRLSRLRASTPARIFLPRAGAAIATKANLGFQMAHAQARDAVGDRLDAAMLADELRAHGHDTVYVNSAAADRRTFLMRPDLGRRLDDASRLRLAAISGKCDVLFVVVDGLSARAITTHAVPLLDAALPAFKSDLWKIGPIVVVQQGRVAIGDEIGEILGATLLAVLIGERPGLSSPDSLGVYLTFAPRVGRTDAERNCLSNIRQQGMSYTEAAAKLFYLCGEARRRRISGVELKDEFMGSRFDNRAERTSGAPLPAPQTKGSTGSVDNDPADPLFL